MRVLVIGGCGFIGSSIVESYAAQGHTVDVIDDFSNNVVTYTDVPIEVLYCYDAGQGLPEVETPPDLVVHAASPVGAAGILSWRGRLASEIVRTTRCAVDYCVELGIPLIYISSSEVYGFSGTYHESDDLRVPARLNTRLEYAVGKIAAEASVRLTPGLRSVTIRPFNVVGPRQRSGGGFVFPTFAEQVWAKRPLTVYGDGLQRRAFTAVQDVARFVTMIEPRYFDGRVVNVGNPGNEVSIGELAERFRSQTGHKSDIVYTDGKTVHGAEYEEAAGRVKLPSVMLAKRMGWTPTFSLERITEDVLVSVMV